MCYTHTLLPILMLMLTPTADSDACSNHSPGTVPVHESQCNSSLTTHNTLYVFNCFETVGFLPNNKGVTLFARARQTKRSTLGANYCTPEINISEIIVDFPWHFSKDCHLSSGLLLECLSDGFSKAFSNVFSSLIFLACNLLLRNTSAVGAKKKPPAGISSLSWVALRSVLIISICKNSN